MPILSKLRPRPSKADSTPAPNVREKPEEKIKTPDKRPRKFLKHLSLSKIQNPFGSKSSPPVPPSPMEAVRPEASSIKSGQGRHSKRDSDTSVTDVNHNSGTVVEREDHKPSAIDELEAIKLLLKEKQPTRILGVESQRIEKILKIIDKYMIIVDVAIQQSPNITALVWAGVRLTVQVALNRFQTFECLENGIQRIVTTMSDCEFYERIYAASTLASNPAFKSALEQVYSIIEKYVGQVKQYFERPGLIAAFSPFSVEFQPLVDDIISKEQTVRKLADQASMQGIQEITNHIAAMDEYRTDMKIKFEDMHLSIKHLVDAKADEVKIRVNKKLQKILDRLYKDTVDSRHSEIRSKRKEGTGKWLLESAQFNDWRRGDSGSALLWAHGIAGAGKTYLSSIVIDHLSNYHSEASRTNVGVAHTYFNYKEQGSQGLSNILGSLIKQLCQQLPGLPESPSHLENLTRDGRTPSQEELFIALVETSKAFSQKFIVFDALDECDRQTQRQTLLPMIHRMGEAGFRIFMTSRRYPDDIEDSFRNVPSIEIIAHDEDIKSYIHEKINADPPAKKRIQAAGLYDEVISHLIRAAGGMFLFVDLNIRYLCEQPTGRHIMRELERLQKAQTTDKPMDPTYDRIVDAVRNQPTACVTLAIRILAWIVKAQRVLKINELQIAVSLEADMTKLEKMDMLDEGKLIDCSHGLIVMDDMNKTVRLAHVTAQEYLNRKSIIPRNSDTTLAIACITYLSFDEFKNHNCQPCRYSIQCHTHNFFKYAVANLLFHLNSSNQELTVAVFGRFLENEDNVLSYFKTRSSNSVIMPGKPLSLLVASALGHTVMVKHLLKKGYDISTTDQELLTPLHLASGNGHLELVRLLLEKGANQNAVDKSKNTPLHLASKYDKIEVARLLVDSGGGKAGNCLDTPLHLAARNGHLGLVKLHLEKGANPNAVDESKDTPLHLASKFDRIEVTRFLLDGGADATLAGNNLYTPLHWAAITGHLELVKLLLENRANPNAVDKSHDTPLHKAATNGHTEVARLLLDTGADATLAGNDLYIPLHFASRNGHLELVKLLLEIGVNLNAVNKLKNTPLHLAAEYGHTEVARLLVDSGADSTLADYNLSTPLHFAAIEGHRDLVKLLLGIGVNLNAVDKWKNTPLHRAAEHGHTEVARLLVDSGAIPTLASNNLNTPLHWAAKKGHIGIVKLLLKKGANPNAVDKSNDTPLHGAATNGHTEVARLLVDSGADATLAGNDLHTPLHFAARNGHLELGKLLLEIGVNLNAVNKLKNTPLHRAAEYGHTEVARLLVDSGADATLAEIDLYTPLHWAATKGNIDLVKLLLEKGVNLNAVDKWKNTPLHRAAEYGHTEVARLLVDSGADTTLANDQMSTPLQLAQTQCRREVISLLLPHQKDTY